MVKHHHHRRDEPFEVVDERLIISTGQYGISNATCCRLDHPAVKLQNGGAGLLCVLDKGVNECGLSNPCDPVQVNYSGPPMQQILEGVQLRCAADEGGPLRGN
jgi:hypothetical protein